jgi:hypothetical protein
MKTRQKTRIFALCAFVAVAIACPASAQPGGGNKGGFKPGGDKGGWNKGGWNKTPEERFKELAKGKDYIVIAEMPFFFKGGMEKYASENGITDGKLTLQQYVSYSDAFKKQMEKGGMWNKGNPQGGGTIPIKIGDLKQGGKFDIKMVEQKPETPEEFEARLKKETDAYFKRQDQNGDGVLNLDEMSPSLRANYKKFDKNKDDLIDYDECKEYMRAKLKGELDGQKGENKKGDDKKGSSSSGTFEIIIELSVLEERPVVYTGTQLPAGLPAWFAELDKDKDGQIGLYEWLGAKKPLSEFKAMDRNQDGFLTPDEVLFFINGGVEPAAASAESGSPNTAAPGDKKGKGKFGGFPGGKKGGGNKSFPFKGPAN